MAELAELLAQPFLRPALAAALLSSVLCGALGTFVVLRRLTFLSGGLSHAAFGGLGLCHLLGLPPQLGGLATTTLAALILGPLPRTEARSRDALIGVFWAVGMAAGVLFLHLTPGYPPDLSAYLFGNLLLVAPGDLVWLAAFDAATLLFLGLFFKELVALTFDETFAAVQGVPVRLFSTVLLLLVGAAVVLLLPVVGLLLVLALLTIPPLLSLELSRSLKGIVAASMAIGFALCLGGLAIALLLDLPAGPCIILLGASSLGATKLVRRLLGRVGKPPARARRAS